MIEKKTSDGDTVRVSEDTELSVPLRNLIAVVGVVVVATWGYAAVEERLNKLESKLTIVELEQKQNSEFRIEWPRGTLGSLPDDSEQNMRLDYLYQRLDDMGDLGTELSLLQMRITTLEERSNGNGYK
mgnify:CR=1 FL=1